MPRGSPNDLHDLAHVSWGWILCYEDPAQSLTTAVEELDDLDHDLSDLSVRGVNTFSKLGQVKVCTAVLKEHRPIASLCGVNGTPNHTKQRCSYASLSLYSIDARPVFPWTRQSLFFGLIIPVLV